MTASTPDSSASRPTNVADIYVQMFNISCHAAVPRSTSGESSIDIIVLVLSMVSYANDVTVQLVYLSKSVHLAFLNFYFCF